MGHRAFVLKDIASHMTADFRAAVLSYKEMKDLIILLPTLQGNI